MMSVADWRKRAYDCMMAAERAPNSDERVRWLALSNAWLECADWRDREKFEDNEPRIAVPVTVTAERDRPSATEYGERLRARLSLVDADDASVPSTPGE